MKQFIIICFVLITGCTYADYSNDESMYIPHRGIYYYPENMSGDKNECRVFIDVNTKLIRFGSLNCSDKTLLYITDRFDKLIRMEKLEVIIGRANAIVYNVEQGSKDIIDIIKFANGYEKWPFDIKDEVSKNPKYRKHDDLVLLLKEMKFFEPFQDTLKTCCNLNVTLDLYPITRSEKFGLINAKTVIIRGYIAENAIKKKYYPNRFEMYFYKANQKTP